MKEEQRSSTSNIEQISSLFNALSTAWKKTSEKISARKIDADSKDSDKMVQSDSTSLSTEVKGIEYNS